MHGNGIIYCKDNFIIRAGCVSALLRTHNTRPLTGAMGHF